jgi:hypothetical protein
MSNLNVNNVDVQRMILVLRELQWKIDVCSCLTMSTFDSIKSYKDTIIDSFGERIFNILQKHYDIMCDFRQENLIYKEERKEEKNEDESGEEDEGPKEITKEKQNLKHIKEEIFQTHPLSKSTKNIYRELKENPKLVEYLKSIRADKEITGFSNDLAEVILSEICKSKMTLEEEQSERDLNLTLTNKIDDMLIQIKEKKNKLEKLIEDKTNFKKNCTANLADIKNQIENLKKSTIDEMTNLENEINDNLESANKLHQEDIKADTAQLEKINQTFLQRKGENAGEEKILVGELNDEENKLKVLIDTYDANFRDHKKNIEDLNKDIMYADINIKISKEEKDRNKEQFELYDKNQKSYEEKVKQDNMERIMEEYACNWIQNIFRGYTTRKQLRKKYVKILAGLRKVKPDMTVDKDPKKNKRK